MAARSYFSLQIDNSQEFIALGMANFIGSFFQAYPVTGSFCRTPINAKTGAHTLLSGVLAGTIVIIAIELLSDCFKYIPQASLAAIVMVAVIPLIDIKARVIIDIAIVVHTSGQAPLRMWRVCRLDILPYTTCFVAVLFAGVEIGIAAAVGLSLVAPLYRQAR